MAGLVHIYTGEGKGKTTAAAGLALRFAGNGGRVFFAQFLKDGTSGEVRMLRTLPDVQVMTCEECFGFSFQMNDETREKACEAYTKLFYEATGAACAACGENEAEAGSSAVSGVMLVLDEIIAACRTGMVPADELTAFLKRRPENMEIVLTGRDPDPAWIDLADYVSEIRKEKHPFDCGIVAREGVEY